MVKKKSGKKKAEKKEDIVEKKEDIVEKTVKDKDFKEKQNKQIILIGGLMLAVIIIIIAVPLIKHNFFDRFHYINLDFQKTPNGDDILYSTEFPVIDEKGQITHTYSIYFNNDPRELEDIDIAQKIKEQGVQFIQKNTAFISIDPDMNPCSDNSVAMFTLGNFLSDSGLVVKSAFSDKEYAEATGFPYKDCRQSSSNTVIKISSGNKTKIDQKSTNCYEVVYKDCEIQQVTEKFILIILEDYMDQFQEA